MALGDGEAWLGIDLGTQGVRALLVTGEGRVLGSGTAPLRGRREGVRHEQDPGEWWEGVCAACRGALRARRHPVGGVAVCGTSGTVLLTDATGRPVGPGLMYDDGRAGVEAARLREAGLAVQDTWALPKAVWLVREYGDEAGVSRVRLVGGAGGRNGVRLVGGAGGRNGVRPVGGTGGRNAVRPVGGAGGRNGAPGPRLAHQPDVINARLTGGPCATDSSHALKTGYDLERGVWPRNLGVPGELLPEVVSPGTRLGEVCAPAADATGIPVGTPVIAGMTDGCAAQIAAGALHEGSWNSVLGTTLVLKGASRTPVRDSTGVVYNHRAPDGSWLPGGASSVGAGALTALFAGADPADMDRRAAAYEPSGAIAYPLVSPGERFPFLAPDATALLLGEPASDADLWAALLQGVAFTERLCLDYLDHLGAPLDGPLTFTGGAARSAYWNQLRADVLGRPARVPDRTEPSLGMAALAAYGTGATRTLAECADRMVHISTLVEPRPAHTTRFAEPYARLVDELEHRGWLPAPVAAHARARVGLDTAKS